MTKSLDHCKVPHIRLNKFTKTKIVRLCKSQRNQSQPSVAQVEMILIDPSKIDDKIKDRKVKDCNYRIPKLRPLAGSCFERM